MAEGRQRAGQQTHTNYKPPREKVSCWSPGFICYHPRRWCALATDSLFLWSLAAASSTASPASPQTPCGGKESPFLPCPPQNWLFPSIMLANLALLLRAPQQQAPTVSITVCPLGWACKCSINIYKANLGMSEWVRPTPDFLTFTVALNARDRSKGEECRPRARQLRRVGRARHSLAFRWPASPTVHSLKTQALQSALSQQAVTPVVAILAP